MDFINIDQVLPTITTNDAISTEALWIYRLLNKTEKFKVKIYAGNIHPTMRFVVKNIKKIRKRNKNSDVLLYHFSIGDENLDKIINKYNYRTMIFHNLTPPDFFKNTNPPLYNLLNLGILQLKKYKNKFDIIFADSLYNKKFLVKIGYSPSKILELPIVKKIKNYAPTKKIVVKYTKKKQTNFLFVGRIAPNKKIEDIIKSFYYYKKLINENANLFLVGKYSIKNRYFLKLKYLIKLLNLDNVLFFRDINDKKLATLYKIADIFICMSEHEGFCVPLIESMFFKVPIIAFNSTAVPFTLRNTGILLHKKNYAMIAEIINLILTNNDYKNYIINQQFNTFKNYYDSNKTINIIIENLSKLLRSN